MYNDADNGFKIHEFVAHSTEIKCLSFGPKSHQVLATGGNDFKVNIWKVGNASNIWTLGQNKSAIECLCFDAEEQYVVSGATNGSIKVFDLNEGRLARNLSGHQVNTCSIQYHPYGEFIVSGSVDCAMKVWDVRNKACIQTYSGHKKEITCVRFSPDGRWIASSGKDNQLLIWDLVAGKLLNTIRLDPAYVTSFEFNPAEFIIGAVTSNRNVRLWDLESMEPLTNTPSDSSPIRAMAFSSDGNSIYTGTKDSLKSFSWEPSAKMKSTADIGWDKVAELRISADGSKLTAGSFNSNFVSVWSVDLDRLSDAAGSKRSQPQSVQRPARSKAVPGDTVSRGYSRGSDRDGSNIDYNADSKSAARNNIPAEDGGPEMQWASDEARTDLASTMSASFNRRSEEMKKNMNLNEDQFNDSKIGKPDARDGDYCKSEIATAVQEMKNQALPSKSNVPQSPQLPLQMPVSSNSRFGREEVQESPSPCRSSGSSADREKEKDRDRKVVQSSAPESRNGERVAGSGLGSRPRSGAARSPTPVTGMRGRTPLKAPVRADPRDHTTYDDVDKGNVNALDVRGLRSAVGQTDTASGGEGRVGREDPSLRAAARRAAAAAIANTPSALLGNRAEDRVQQRGSSSGSASDRDRERDRDKERDGERERDAGRGLSREQREGEVSAILDRVFRSSGPTAAITSQRLAALKIVKRLWVKGDLQDVIEYMGTVVQSAVHDPSQLVLLADVFSSIELKGTNFTLQSCVGFMSILDSMLSSSDGLRVSAVVCAALKGFTELCQGFGELIRSSRAMQLAGGGGVDLSREERLRKCHACHGVVFKMLDRFDRIRQMHRTDYKMMDIVDTLSPLLENILIS